MLRPCSFSSLYLLMLYLQVSHTWWSHFLFLITVCLQLFWSNSPQEAIFLFQQQLPHLFTESQTFEWKLKKSEEGCWVALWGVFMSPLVASLLFQFGIWWREDIYIDGSHFLAPLLLSGGIWLCLTLLCLYHVALVNLLDTQALLLCVLYVLMATPPHQSLFTTFLPHL